MNQLAVFPLLVLCASTTGCLLQSDWDGEPVDEAHLGLSAPKANGYSFGRDADERRKGVPITKDPKWHVIYSVPLKDLDSKEHLAVRGEVQLTTCQASDLNGHSPCQRITPFDPKYKAKVVLGTSKSDPTGPDLTGTRDVNCTHFHHHCAIALDERVTTKHSGFRFANLVVAAVDNNAGGPDVMEVNEHHGGLYVTRIGKSAPVSGKKFQGHVVTSGWMKLDMENKHPRKDHVTLQVALHGAKPGDVIDAEALIVAKTRGNGGKPGGCSGARDPLITHQNLRLDPRQ